MRRLLTVLLLFLSALLPAQEAALKDTFLQAKALWATQGDREGATARLDSVVAALAPLGPGLASDWMQVLCETYNWLAVLDDRGPQTKARAQVRLQALVDLNPDFELDRALTSQRLTALHERLRSEKFGLVKLSFLPEGGHLLVDGRPGAPLPRRFLSFGVHKIAYTRPGYAAGEFVVEVGPREVRSVAFNLTRTSSALTLHTHPANVEVWLDGRRLGHTQGRAGEDATSLALPLGLKPEELSAPFVVADLAPGKHTLELKGPCLRTRRLELGADLTTPFADHTLEALRMEPSRGTLSVRSDWPGGELFLSGQSQGPLPIVDLPVCAGTYDLTVKFPAGGFARKLVVIEGQAARLEARPLPRLAFLGLEGGAFTGRDRLQAMLDTLGERLPTLACLPPVAGEPPAVALARLRASRETELVLTARPVADPVVHRVELVLATLDGLEEHRIVKPLEEDPLGPFLARLNRMPPTQIRDLGLSLLDVPGEPGPWVLGASETALQAGIQTGRPLLQAGGKPVSSRSEVLALLEGAGTSLPVQQGPEPLSLPLRPAAVEVPLGASDLSYPTLLARLRLAQAGAKGDDAAILRLNEALVLMQFRRYDKAIERLRDTRLAATRGVGQGTLDYHTGQCFLRLGPAYQSEAAQAFRQALKYPQSTLLDPDGPLVAPLAAQALEDLK